MAQYVDSHCHLSQTEIFSEVFARAQQNGIQYCVLNSINESDWNNVINIANDNTNVRGAIGIHPWYVDSVSQNWDSDLEELLINNQNLMMGEIGLDKTRDNFSTQEKIFIRELELAMKYKRIMNIHCVHAWDIMAKILKNYRSYLPKIIMHAFDGTQNVIDFDADIYFSYSPNIANPDYKKVRVSIHNVPKNRILIESDSSNLQDTLIASGGVLSLLDNITTNDIFNNAMGVFFNE